MRRRFGQSLRLGVAGDTLALVETGRWQSARLVAEQRVDGQPGAALAALLGGAARDGWPLTIVLADELVRLWPVTPPVGSSGMADLEAAAGLRFHALFGEPAAAWSVSAAWDARHPFLAAAVSLTLRAQLEQACAAHRISIVECVPQFVAALNQWRGVLRTGAWFGLVHEQVLTLGVVGAGGVEAVRATAFAEGADSAWLAQHIAREAMRLNLTAPERVQLCGQVPPGWRGSQLVSPLGAGSDWSGAARLALTGSAA